jgi:hypothetical protein
MSSFRLPLLASLALIAFCWGGGQARAGDFEDCTGPIGDKTKAACTAVVNDAQRPAEDRVKAYINRSRFSTGRGKFEAAISDADAALARNPQSV